MSRLARLRQATTLHDVAALLELKPGHLSHVIYAKTNAQKYRVFEIPKKGGGKRTITAPLDDLALLQWRTSRLLQDCLDEIEANSSPKKADLIVHGFKRKRSISSNAHAHHGRRYVFNIDLKDFFPSINFGRVRGYFLKDSRFQLQPTVATVLARIACFNNELPQGSPCSPVISNLVARILDLRLLKVAAAHQCRYTRYADDITFSTNEKDFPRRIAIIGADGDWLPAIHLKKLIEDTGFAVNPEKTRMHYRDSAQVVTGLTVNRRINVARKYRTTVRAMVHRLIRTGTFRTKRLEVTAAGAVQTIEVDGDTTQLAGMLSFIDSVDRFHESRKRVVKKHAEDEADKEAKEPKNTKKEEPSRLRLYRQFVMFEMLYRAPKPTIICEGETDNVYLVHALRAMAETFPRLAEKNAAGDIALKVRLLKYSRKRYGELLGLSGGASRLAELVHVYRKYVKRFFFAGGAKGPIVLVTDRDAGWKSVKSAIQSVAKGKMDDSLPFFHVEGNLYVVPTPLVGGVEESAIEDMFKKEVLEAKVDGKSFNASNKKASSTEYGKIVFAHKVIAKNAATIDFSGFEPLLKGIDSAIEHCEKNK